MAGLLSCHQPKVGGEPCYLEPLTRGGKLATYSEVEISKLTYPTS